MKLLKSIEDKNVMFGGSNGPLFGGANGMSKAVPCEKKKEGFAYAYQYPGMNKVLQAAGRVIRTADDRGVIGLLDMRFLRRDYSDLFPREWNGSYVCNLRVLPRMLAEFWEKW